MAAGYSGTPLYKKMGIVEGSRVSVAGEPFDLAAIAGPLPAGARFITPGESEADVLLLVTRSRAILEAEFARLATGVAKRGGFWIAWPKRASKVPTDITEDVLRELILPTGWVDNKVCAIDEQWSGLRFVRRLRAR